MDESKVTGGYSVWPIDGIGRLAGGSLVTLLHPWILEDEVLSPEDLPPAGLRVTNVAVVVEDADRLPGQLQEGVLHLCKGDRSKDGSI